MRMISSGSAPSQISQKTVIVIIRISQCLSLYFGGIMHRTGFVIKLNHLAPKDNSNHCGSLMLRKWNDQHSCWPLTFKGLDGTFKLWYFARYSVHLILVLKSFNIADIFNLIIVFWSAIRLFYWLFLIRLSTSYFCKWVSASICVFIGIYGFVQNVNTNVNVQTSTLNTVPYFKDTVIW
jgi:hypothetical protein